MAWTLSLAAVPPAVIGVRNFLAGVFIIEGRSVKRIVGSEGLFYENANDLALLLNLILPLTVALLLMERGRLVRLLLAGVVLVDVLAVILTFSRAGFLTMATTCGLYCWRLSRRAERGWAVIAIVLALAALPLLPPGYIDRINTITSSETDPTGSAQLRWADTFAAVSFVLAHPIVGAGVGMDVLVLNEERGPLWVAVHNVYLQVAVDLGLPGLILFLMLLLGTIRGVRIVRRGAAGDPVFRDFFHLAEGLEISLIGFAVAALFYPVAYHFHFYQFAGLGVAIQAISRKPEPRILPEQEAQRHA